MNSSTDRSYPEYTTIECRADFKRSIVDAWRILGTFGTTAKFLGVSSVQVSGDGGPGSIRLIGDAILEVMVGASLHGYTYAQIEGPMARYQYHGSISLEPVDGDQCRILYSLTYDHTAMDADMRASERTRLQSRFDGAVKAMQKAVEAE
jgi:hypothetical protein